MEFNDFKKEFQKQFTKMTKEHTVLFLTDVDKNTLWDSYLESFPEGTNEIYKENREYDCNCCKSFIRAYGNIVGIDTNNELVSIWDIPNLETPFKEVTIIMSTLVKAQKIKNKFVSKIADLGTDNNKQIVEETGKVLTWDHFYYKLPASFVTFSSDSIESIQGTFRDCKNVFARSMEELTVESAHIILELIDQNSLYRGEEQRRTVETFLLYKRGYEEFLTEEILSQEATDIKIDNWLWMNSFKTPISKIRNTAIGTLLIDLSENVDLDIAVTKFEKIMAPTNYKRPKTLFTKKMVEDAEKKIVELGFSDSLERRFAKLDDITVNNLLFVNRDARKQLKNSVFDDLKEDVPEKTNKFDKVDEVNIEDFVKNILPTATNIELMIENRHTGNLMSLIAPKNLSAASMLKWNNNFSWSYNGDITDSMKQNVKKAGGNVEGVLRFSIQWNTENEHNPNDFDAHCIEPDGNRIFFENKKYLHPSTGMLDVDIINPKIKTPAVENITWTDINKMKEGKYQFLIHNYSHRGGTNGFSAEIEYDGQIYSFEYVRELKRDEKVLVAEIIFDKINGIKFVKSLDSSISSKELWGVKTNQFSKVSICMYSPNYWDDQDNIGNRHYFFFLDGCKNEESPRGFFNEFLKENLQPHRKVFEALGSKMRVESTDNQLSGLGFSSTQKNSVLCKVEGAFTRVIKITF